MTHEEAMTENKSRMRGCRGRPLTAQESIIGDAEDIIYVARNMIEAIWMAVAESDGETREPIRAIADAAKGKLDEALAKLQSNNDGANR